MAEHDPGELELEVFRAGDYGARGAFTDEDLRRIADRYDPGAHEAPVTTDHRQSGPALGWVRRLRAEGARLFATLGALAPDLVRDLRQGAFKKRSVELFREFGPEGGPYLKAVSFLGAAAPAVKGMEDPVFCEDLEPLRPRGGSGAALLRNRLRAAGRWHPRWDGLGLAAAFSVLEEAGSLDALGEAFDCLPPLAPLAAAPFRDGTDARRPEEPAGATPESIGRHRAALAYLDANPSAGYAEALLAAGRP